MTALPLGVNQLCIYDFCCTVTNIIHSRNPQHLIVCFKLFGYAFFFGELFYQPKEQFLCLFIYVGEICGQLAARQQIGVSDFVVLLYVPQMPILPFAVRVISGRAADNRLVVYS